MRLLIMKTTLQLIFILLTFLILQLSYATSLGNATDPMSEVTTHKDQCVILLHGLGRKSGSMETIANALRDQQYKVWNKDYDSRSDKIESLATKAVAPGVEWCKEQGAQKIHFVTHSLGGILVRYYFQNIEVEEVSRIVMLAPPSQGSTVADLLSKNYLYKKITGPAGQQLGTNDGSLPNQLEPISGEIGVIAGTGSLDPWFTPFIEGENDGKVRVEDTRLDEMIDFLVVDHSHTYIMRSDGVIQQIKHFLETGKFDRTNTTKKETTTEIMITNDK